MSLTQSEKLADCKSKDHRIIKATAIEGGNIALIPLKVSTLPAAHPFSSLFAALRRDLAEPRLKG
jgi:hypothetical protein